MAAVRVDVGADPARFKMSKDLHRSVPIKKALDDAMIALYPNGERIQPGKRPGRARQSGLHFS